MPFYFRKECPLNSGYHISLWLQEGIKPTTTLQKGLRQAITDFANWQQATRVTLGRCPQGLFTDCRAGWEIDPVA